MTYNFKHLIMKLYRFISIALIFCFQCLVVTAQVALTDPIIFRAIDRGAKELEMPADIYRNIGGKEVKGNSMVFNR